MPGKVALIPGDVFPDDLDTTSLALKVLRPSSSKTVSSLLDTMAQYVNDDGSFKVSHEVAEIFAAENYNRLILAVVELEWIL